MTRTETILVGLILFIYVLLSYLLPTWLIVGVVLITGLVVSRKMDNSNKSITFSNTTTNNNHSQSIPNWKLYTGNRMYLPPELKAEYIKSKEWQKKKLLHLLFANYKCQVCGSTNNLELHHITYERLTTEQLEDLAILCRNCHQKIHDKLGYDRVTKYPIETIK